jgi:hypothetical protein
MGVDVGTLKGDWGTTDFFGEDFSKIGSGGFGTENDVTTVSGSTIKTGDDGATFWIGEGNAST